MKKITPFLLGITVLFGAAACQDLERTDSDAPSSLDETTDNPAQVEDARDNSTSDIRRDQLDSDIRAREQRTDVVGDPEDRSDGDLASEVRSKLEANIPQSKLAVTSEDGVVTVVGTVPNQERYDSIETLAREIRGVQDVTIDVQIVEPAENPDSDAE
ncbi:BON domain-containing protein [Sodalinema gerasimenkoae]|uniref:BON domain-containing protein n=1 Tax=Sodalinema gerasimenkoae TaxID=2862348 RepID=UPI0013569B01|nr:BON domain-containing protein [Sodalinema gerasimenkoae]